MMDSRIRKSIHPITGRPDPIRQDGAWRYKIDQLEGSLGYVICGARVASSGEPCIARAEKGEHRCKKHTKTPGVNPNGRCKYPPNVGYGMKLNTFIQCHRCKDDFCSERITDKDIISDGEDDCPIEKDVYSNVMALSEKYIFDGDYLQEGMLETVAYTFIKRYRAEKAIAMEGMVVEDIMGFRKDGSPFSNKRAHPLLKPLNDFGKELISFAKALEFSPEAVNKNKGDVEKVDATKIISDILKSALMKGID